MIPILSDSATLQGNGLGGLNDAIECVVTDEVNGEYELRMRYPVTGEHYGEIQNNLIIFAEPMALATAQPFRIYRITKPLNGVVTIYARHLAYDMSGIVVKPFSALSLTAALSAVPTYSVPSCPFTLTSTRTITSKMEIDEPRPLWTLLGGSAGSFLDVYGGEWEFDGYTATLKTKLGEDRGVVIRYGKNLTELETDSDLSSTYGGVFPYWYDEEEGLVTIQEGYVPVTGSVFTRILLLDCSSDFDDKPTEAQLRTKAQSYIENNSVGSPKDSWKVSFAQLAQAGEYETQALLEEVQLGDTVSVIYEALGVNASARVVKTEWDVLGDKYKAVTIGRVKQNLASILVGQNKETERAISQTKSALERAISSATDFIKHGTGVMRFIYNEDGDLMEIVSLDNADLSQAQSVWRWNQGGFGHSSTGYNGTYTTAITQDGQIVADFITTGTLSGNRVRTGLIEDETGTNYWNLDTGEFHSQTLENAITANEEGISLVSEKLNNIGGRNILLNSTTVHWEAINSATVSHTDGVSVSEWGCNDAIRATGTGGQTAIILQLLHTSQTAATLLADRKYVMSCWIKNNSAMALRLAANNGTSDEIAPGEQKRAVVYADGDGSSALRMRMATQQPGEAFDFIYWHPQIEYGEVMTSWNPAPEDAEAAIAANSAAIQVNATNIASKVSQTDYNGNTIASLINQTSTSVQIQASKVDLQGYVTFSNLSTSGQTSINGANIITGTLNANAIAANSTFTQNLTATNFNITGGSINITTAAETTDAIQLNYGTSYVLMNPLRIEVGDTNGTFGNYACVMRALSGTFGVYDPTAGGSGTLFNVSAHTGTLSLKGATTPGVLDLTSNTGNATVVLAGGNGFNPQNTPLVGETALVFFDDSSSATRPKRMNLTKDGLTFKNTSGITLATYEIGGFSFTNAAGVLRAKLDSDGLGFYYGASNGLSAFYPANGMVQSRATVTANSSKTVTFSGSTLAIICMLGSNGNMYGMWTYSGYGSGTARQHINAILGPGGGVSCAIDASTQSVTVTNNVSINCGLYVLTLVGNFPTIS